ncbi:hypothetical protein BBI01_17820 [Chryseobacterium artocarpi]|uniref:Secretion system C-terminal sorting domain-containing protein n=1 Tax=Chryseobacterium artocarpi TaxID=1414727 RepID=A0A1B8ZBU6_9FLAO|nr:T9SS type A sorting domain-containing protein [Chryseobacterium artocarpi]OCA69070.1 hypothetical protein BBI01_17820 [Chryseobacterium artocarpi]
MNLKNILIISSLLLNFLGFNAQVVNIPDEYFYEYLLLYNNIDKNNDGLIQVSEAEAYTGQINVIGYSNIKNLTGLEAFKNITDLQVSKTGITALDISNNTKLVKLVASSTNLTSIDVSKNTELTEIQAQLNSNLKSVIFGSQNYNQLQSVNLSFNSIESIDVTHCPNLAVLNLTLNKLTSVDVSKNPRLAQLDLGSNKITDLNLLNNKRLTFIGIAYNQIKNIDLSQNTLINIFNGTGNPIESLNVSKNIYLTQLLIDETSISDLDVTMLPMLGYLYVNKTNLKNIDASQNSNIFGLQASGCPNLETVNMKNGNNTNVVLCVTTNNPKLTCIQVDNAEYSSNAFLWEKDETATYVTDCALLSSTEVETSKNITPFPNPTQNFVNINEIAYSMALYSSNGNLVISGKDTKKIDMSKLPSGVYYLQIKMSAKEAPITKKIVKK